MSDEELMRGYQENQEAAFAELYERYAQRVFHFIQPRLRASEAEDFYQKVWRRLHEKRSLYRGQPFAAWFFVLIKHFLIDEYRSLGKPKVLPQLEAAIIVEEQDVEELLRELPLMTAELVRGHYLEEKSYEELAQMLGISEGTVRQRLSRAIRSLRAKLGGVS